MKDDKWPKVFTWKNKRAFWYFKDEYDHGIWFCVDKPTAKTDFTPEQILSMEFGVPSTEEELTLFLLEHDIKHN